MPSAELKTEAVLPYSLAELKLVRADIVQYARMFPPGPQRNHHRQIALSLRALFRNEAWLAAHVRED
jgi:hypothetical protein